MTWTFPYRDFEGTTAETAEALAELHAMFPWAQAGPQPSIRLLRHYTQEGALDRPERRGKEAYYGFRHLVQYLAVRWLLTDGWPLAKAADETSSRTTDQLLTLIPTTDGSTSRRLIAGRDAPGGEATASADAVAARQRQIAERRARIAALLDEIDADTPSPDGPRELLHLEITRWCTALVEAARVETLTDADAEILGDALTQALLDARASPGGRRNSRRSN